MSELIHGWRWRIGLATLAVACVFMGLWIRGFAIQDLILPGNGQGVVTRGSVLVMLSFSARDGLVWARQEMDGLTWLAGWQVRPTEGERYFDPFLPGGHSLSPHSMHYHWRLFGIDISRYHEKDYGAISFWRISYSTIVIPLTLTSLWLLLYQPLKSTHQRLINRYLNWRSDSQDCKA